MISFFSIMKLMPGGRMVRSTVNNVGFVDERHVGLSFNIVYNLSQRFIVEPLCDGLGLNNMASHKHRQSEKQPSCCRNDVHEKVLVCSRYERMLWGCLCGVLVCGERTLLYG